MTLEQIARLYVIFKTLQPEVKEWIASDDTAAIIKAIAARFVLSDEQERALPILVLRLVTQDLPPESFKAELAKETGADAELAKGVTEAIAKEVIGPVAAALRYGGIDTNLLGFNAPAAPAGHAEQAVPRPAPAPQAEVVTPAQAPAPEAPKPATAQPPVASQKPFILHEEPQAAASGSSGANRSFSYSPQTETGTKVPPRVVIERVVHYSQLRTPLNVAGARKSILQGERPQPKMPQSKWFI